MAAMQSLDDLLFTQDSIKNTFSEPRQSERLDDAVDSLLQGRILSSSFPRLNVVLHEGLLWCLNNRRLWVFKKVGLSSIVVNLVSSRHPRFISFMRCSWAVKCRLMTPGFLPTIRGFCRYAVDHESYASAGLVTVGAPNPVISILPGYRRPYGQDTECSHPTFGCIACANCGRDLEVQDLVQGMQVLMR